MRQSSVFVSLLACGLLIASSVGCTVTVETESAPVGNYVTRVTASNGAIVAELHDGTPPETGTGPTLTAIAAAGVTLVGGSQIYNVTATASFTTVVVWVEGVDGYYTIEGLPSGIATTIVVTISQSAPTTFEIDMAAGTSGGTSVGPAVSVPVVLTEVGTGDVQVSLAWDAPSDIDLHVVDPAGSEIYYSARSSASGGELDLDSNPGCSIDNKNNENITWADGTAPRGTYVVRVDNYSACSQSPINCVITVNVSGEAPVTYTHTFTDTGDHGGLGAGVEITRFTY